MLTQVHIYYLDGYHADFMYATDDGISYKYHNVTIKQAFRLAWRLNDLGYSDTWFMDGSGVTIEFTCDK